MNVNIIGGSGFIGTRLVSRLHEAGNFVVKIFDKKKSESFLDICNLGDVRSIDALRNSLREKDIVINLAAEHRDNVQPISLYYEVNTEGARNIALVAREKSITKIIFASTVAVYGFAPIGTDETGTIAPFNDYGRSKYAAEQIFVEWQLEDPAVRTLVIVRPTVVFGEQNRGNVYNLLRQISSGKFVMIGAGTNRKSICYVENVAAFLEYAISFQPGIHVSNFVDRPDFTMNELIRSVRGALGKQARVGPRLPYLAGLIVGKFFDAVTCLTGKQFPISAIRVKKFCADSVYKSSASATGFVPPVPLIEALLKTVRHEFIENHSEKTIFYSE